MCVLGIYVCYMVASLRGTKRERVESERQRERKGCVCVYGMEQGKSWFLFRECERAWTWINVSVWGASLSWRTGGGMHVLFLHCFVKIKSVAKYGKHYEKVLLNEFVLSFNPNIFEQGIFVFLQYLSLTELERHILW